jgi:hypothetical protein
VNAGEFANHTSISDDCIGDSARDVFLVLGLHPECHVWENIAVLAEGGVRFNNDVRSQRGVCSNLCICSDRAERPYFAVLTNFCILMNHCKFINFYHYSIPGASAFEPVTLDLQPWAFYLRPGTSPTVHHASNWPLHLRINQSQHPKWTCLFVPFWLLNDIISNPESISKQIDSQTKILVLYARIQTPG